MDWRFAMTSHGRIVSIDHLGSELSEIFKEIESEDIQNKCGEIAYEIVKKYRPVIKAKAKGHIDKKSKRKKYVNNFVSVPKKDGKNLYGASLWNKQYMLSHLIEDPHALWFGGRTGNNYEFFKETEPLMNKEFSNKCRKAVQDALRK